MLLRRRKLCWTWRATFRVEYLFRYACFSPIHATASLTSGHAMSIQSLVSTGTKVWLDSIDPELVKSNRAQGATGATSNPIIISDLIATGRFDDLMKSLFDKLPDDESVAWAMTDKLVS